jgi:hypothetical protein
MSVIPLPSGGGEDFAPLSEGTHLGICVRVVDLGTHDDEYQGRATRNRKIMVSWEIPDEKMTDGRPFVTSRRYTWSMHEKATLRKDLESWRGAKFTDADFGTFDIKNLLGKICLVSIIHEPAKDGSGKMFAKVTGVSKPMKGMAGKTPHNHPTLVWLSPELFDEQAFEALSDRIKDTIKASPEFQALRGGRPAMMPRVDLPPASRATPPAGYTGAPAAPKASGGKVHVIEDDDIPF